MRKKPIGAVYLVGAGPGDPGLLTLRGKECLEKADVVIYDRLANPALLSYAKQAELIDAGKRPDNHPLSQTKISALLVQKARAGLAVVRLKGGDPFVFGRGGEEALALVEAGIPFEVVPGVTSAIAAPAYAGIPVTQRGMADSFAVITGHSPEGEETSRKGGPQAAAVGDLGIPMPGEVDTLVFLIGVQNLPGIVESLLRQGHPPGTPVAVIEQGTTPHQKVVSGTLADIVAGAAGIQPPAVTIVGEVVRLRNKLLWFDQAPARPLFGLRILNTRPQTTLHPAETHDDFSARLSALGAEVFELPAIQVMPIPSALEPVLEALHRSSLSAAQGASPGVPNQVGAPWDWILFTSANAVAAFFEPFFDQGYDARWLAGVRLGAVGKATQQALADYHLHADFVPSRYIGLDWVAEAGNLAGKRVLLPRSEIGQPELVEALRSGGAQVEVVGTYTVQTAELTEDSLPAQRALQALLEGKIDVVVFFSPSAVRGLLDMAGAEQPNASWTLPTVACVGPTTALAARDLGLRVELIAREHTIDGMVEALKIWRALS